MSNNMVERIADYECSPSTINKLLHRFNIQPRSKGWQQ